MDNWDDEQKWLDDVKCELSQFEALSLGIKVKENHIKNDWRLLYYHLNITLLHCIIMIMTKNQCDYTQDKLRSA